VPTSRFCPAGIGELRGEPPGIVELEEGVDVRFPPHRADAVIGRQFDVGHRVLERRHHLASAAALGQEIVAEGTPPGARIGLAEHHDAIGVEVVVHQLGAKIGQFVRLVLQSVEYLVDHPTDGLLPTEHVLKGEGLGS